MAAIIVDDKRVMLVVVSSRRREIHAYLQPRLPHHVNGALERLSSVACTDASGLPGGQLACARRTIGTCLRLHCTVLFSSVGTDLTVASGDKSLSAHKGAYVRHSILSVNQYYAKILDVRYLLLDHSRRILPDRKIEHKVEIKRWKTFYSDGTLTFSNFLFINRSLFTIFQLENASKCGLPSSNHCSLFTLSQ